MKYSVSYFEHERNPLLQGLDEGALNQVDAHAAEIAEAGFTNVVLCMTERDVTQPEHGAFFRDVAGIMRAHKLGIELDAWRVGDMRGGEAFTSFDKNVDGDACYHNPRAAALDTTWLDMAASVQPDRVYVDEPELHCSKHKNDMLAYLKNYIQQAVYRGMESTVCLASNIHKIGDFDTIAGWDGVTGIATDTYIPNPWSDIEPDEEDAYFEARSRHIKSVADSHGVTAENWVQLFAVTDETRPARMLQAYHRAGLDRIGLWSYKAAASTPELWHPGMVPPAAVWESAKRMLVSHENESNPAS